MFLGLLQAAQHCDACFMFLRVAVSFPKNLHPSPTPPVMVMPARSEFEDLKVVANAFVVVDPDLMLVVGDFIVIL